MELFRNKSLRIVEIKDWGAVENHEYGKKFGSVFILLELAGSDLGQCLRGHRYSFDAKIYFLNMAGFDGVRESCSCKQYDSV
jgi:hypothetical protein